MTREISPASTNGNVQSMLPKALIIGGVLGAVVGLTAAYLFIQRNSDMERPNFTAGDGVKIGVMVAGLLRSIAAV